jgi:hypothetical protein
MRLDAEALNLVLPAAGLGAVALRHPGLRL